MQADSERSIAKRRPSRFGSVQGPYEFIKEGTTGEQITDFIEQAIEAGDLQSALIFTSWIVGIQTDHIANNLAVSIRNQERMFKLMSSIVDRLEKLDEVDSELRDEIQDVSEQLRTMSLQSDRLYENLINRGRASKEAPKNAV